MLFVLLPNGARLGRTNPTGQTAALFRRAEEAAGDRGSIAGTLGSWLCSEECLVSIEWKD